MPMTPAHDDLGVCDEYKIHGITQYNESTNAKRYDNGPPLCNAVASQSPLVAPRGRSRPPGREPGENKDVNV